MPATEFSVDAFRQELRAWLSRELPAVWEPRPARSGPGRPTDLKMRRRFDRALYAAGWAGLSWPAAYGGQDAPIDCERILAEEATDAGAPERYNPRGAWHCGARHHRLRHRGTEGPATSPDPQLR